MKKLVKPTVEEMNETKVEALIEVCTCRGEVCDCYERRCMCRARETYGDINSDEILF